MKRAREEAVSSELLDHMFRMIQDRHVKLRLTIRLSQRCPSFDFQFRIISCNIIYYEPELFEMDRPFVQMIVERENGYFIIFQVLPDLIDTPCQSLQWTLRWSQLMSAYRIACQPLRELLRPHLVNDLHSMVLEFL